jgi:ABC-type uncharacterized transport system auxiliary subunit
MSARILLLTTAFLALAGCFSQPSRPTNYYVLEFDASVPGAPDAAESDTAADEGRPALVVQDAEVAPMFDRRQLLQRLEGPLVRYRNAELWAVSPPAAIANLVREGLTRSARFSGITEGRDARGRYEVRTRIDDLTHYCCDAETEIGVGGAFMLIDRRDGTEIALHSFARRERLSDERPRTFVDGVSRILSEELLGFLDAMPTELES